MTPGAQTIIDAAKASVIAYNNKDWAAAAKALAPDAVYDEIASQRKAQGVDNVLTIWKGWAAAMPDSKATFHGAIESGNTVALELTWRGKHTGPLATPTGEVPATNKSFELRAIQVIEMAGSRAKQIRHYFDMATLLQQLGVTG